MSFFLVLSVSNVQRSHDAHELIYVTGQVQTIPVSYHPLQAWFPKPHYIVVVVQVPLSDVIHFWHDIQRGALPFALKTFKELVPLTIPQHPLERL
jgi:hypothetical protein